MVTVPGAEDVRGVGPRRIGPAANPSLELLAGPDLTRATAQLAAALDRDAEQSRLEAEVAQEQAERTQLLKAETDLRFEAFDLFDQVAQDPDNATLATRFDEALNQRIEERVGQLPERSQEAGRQRFELVRRTVGVSALKVQRERLLTEAQQNLEDSLGGFQVQVFRNPESLDSTRAATAAIIQAEGEAIGMPADAIRQEIESNDVALIENALRGLPPATAEARLKAGEFDGDLQAENLIRLTKEFELGANRERAVEANRLRALRDDHLASLQATGVGIRGFRDQMAGVLDEDEFEAFLRAEDTAIRVHDAATGFSQQTQAEIAQTVESFRPVAGSATFADDQQVHQALAKEAVRVLNARTDDPAQSAMLLPEVADEMRAAQEAEDPARFRRALRVRMDAQADLAVSPIGQRVKTKAEAVGLVDQLRSTAADEQAGAMLGLQETYGELFPQLMQELDAAGLDRRFQVLAVVADNPIASREVANVIATGSQELAKGLDKTLVKDTRANVIDALEPFSQAFTAGDLTQASVAQMNEITSVVQDLAVLNLRKGQSASEAATNAADAVINSRFTVEGGLWVPNSIGGEMVSPDKVALLIDQRQAQEAIEAFDPVPIYAAEETPGNRADDQVARLRTIATAVNSGVWVTNETGTGARLMLPDVTGALHPFMDREGNRYEVDFLEASQTPMDVLRPERVPGRLTGPDAGTLPGAILDPEERRRALERARQ